MAKVMYDYVNVQVPTEAKEKVDKIYKERAESGKKVRKADIWLEAIRKLRK